MNDSPIKSDYEPKWDFAMFLSKLRLDYWLDSEMIDMKAGYKDMRSGHAAWPRTIIKVKVYSV